MYMIIIREITMKKKGEEVVYHLIIINVPVT